MPDVPRSFEERVAYWQRLLQEGGGDGGAKARAEAYYQAELFPEVVRRACRASESSLPDGGYDYLVSLSGFTPQTSILAMEILKPQRVLLINSADTESCSNLIFEHASRILGLSYSAVKSRRCDPTDPRNIYRIVHEELESERKSGRKPRAIIDITGGKKVMSAAAAMAAWECELPLCYLESDFNPQLRGPNPGTERLVRLSNPLELFDSQRMAQARELFNKGHYTGAAEIYQRLADNVSRPERARMRAKLARLYEAWCDLDFEQAKTRADSVAEQLGSSGGGLEHQHAKRLLRQAEFLSSLAEGERENMLLCYFVLGRHYLKRTRRRDFAALLFYRTIEGAMALGIERRWDGFSCDEPDYELLGLSVDELLRRYRQLADDLGWGGRFEGLPPFLSFMSSAALLHISQDPLLADAGHGGLSGLNKLQNLGRIRNTSVLAHGFRPVTEDDASKLRRCARKMLHALWRSGGGSQKLEELLGDLRFLELTE